MKSLSELQETFQRGILAGDDAILAEIKDSDKEDRKILFGVYRYACAAVGVTIPPAVETPEAFAQLTAIGQRYETGRCDEATFYDDIAGFTGFTREQVRDIATRKMKDLNAVDVDGAMRMVEGSARSMGLEVVD